MDNKQIETFAAKFVSTLDLQLAANAAGVSLDHAVDALNADEWGQKYIKERFAARVKVYDLVPVDIVRMNVVKMLTDETIPASARIAAGRLIAEMADNSNLNAAKTVGDLMRMFGKPEAEKGA